MIKLNSVIYVSQCCKTDFIDVQISLRCRLIRYFLAFIGVHLRFLLLLTLFINFRGDTSDSDPCFAYFECLLNQGMPFQKVKRRVFFQSEP